MIRRWWWLIPLVAAALAVPVLVRDAYIMYVADLSLIYAMLALGLDLAQGYTGQVSLGHGAFFGIGAYVSALMAVDLKLGFWIGLPTAAVAAGLFGLLVGASARNLEGDYLVMSTLAFGTLFWVVAQNWIKVTRGPMGIPGVPDPPGLHLGILDLRFHDYWTYHYLLLAALGLGIWLTGRLIHSRFGRACLAVREDRVAAEAMGVSVGRYRVIMFGISAAYTGAIGSLFAHLVHVVSPDSFNISTSIQILTTLMIGGQGSAVGAIIGGVLLTAFSEALRAAASYRLLAYGALLTLAVIFMPYGVVGVLRSLAFRLGRRRAAADQSTNEAVGSKKAVG